MIIASKDKDQIMLMLKSALVNISLVNEVTMEVSDAFSLTLDLVSENIISDIMNNPRWPAAVDNFQLVVTDEDKIVRAEGIVYLFMNDDVRGKKVLDFGCGEGHVAQVAAEKGAVISVGYDIAAEPSWKAESSNLLFTDSIEKVRESGPYDIVLLYDVLDHSDDPQEVLETVHGLLAGPTSFVYARCHPWCSRHGGHVYRSLNKAYAHLFLPQEAVDKLSNNAAPVQRVIHPILTYNEWLTKSGFKILSCDIVREQVETFFTEPAQAEKIKNWWKKSLDKDYASGATFPAYQLGQQFLDYVVVKA